MEAAAEALTLSSSATAHVRTKDEITAPVTAVMQRHPFNIYW